MDGADSNDNNDNFSPITGLTPDLQRYMFHHLDYLDLLALCRTCRQLRGRYSDGRDPLWKFYLERSVENALLTCCKRVEVMKVLLENEENEGKPFDRCLSEHLVYRWKNAGQPRGVSGLANYVTSPKHSLDWKTRLSILHDGDVRFAIFDGSYTFGIKLSPEFSFVRSLIGKYTHYESGKAYDNTIPESSLNVTIQPMDRSSGFRAWMTLELMMMYDALCRMKNISQLMDIHGKEEMKLDGEENVPQHIIYAWEIGCATIAESMGFQAAPNTGAVSLNSWGWERVSSSSHLALLFEYYDMEHDGPIYPLHALHHHHLPIQTLPETTNDLDGNAKKRKKAAAPLV